MNLLKKCIVLFAVLTIAFYFLCVGIFARGGLLYNKALEEVLQKLEYRADRLKSDVENLKLHSQELSTEEGIRVTALNLGYAVEGDTVYLFATSELQSADETRTVADYEEMPYKSLSKPLCLLIAASAAALVTVFYALLVRRPSDQEPDLRI